jgi:hypothetical protein
VQFWLIAMACGCLQVLQAMTNGAAARSGIGAIWVGSMSAKVSALTLVVVAFVIYRLALPEADLLQAQGVEGRRRRDDGELRQSRWRLDSSSACCSRVSASRSSAPEQELPTGPRPAQAAAHAPRQDFAKRLSLFIERTRFIVR